MIELRGIYYKDCLENISLKLQGESITVIMGANGAGKSLLLQVISGLLPMSEGTMLNHEQIVTPQDLPIAHLLQHPIMLRRSVIGNLQTALKASCIDKSLWQEKIDSLLCWGRLDNLRHRSARLLSGGQQQILSLLRALACEPQLLLLDEPCANLDPQAMIAVENLIIDSAKKNIKICIVTHDIHQAERLADEIIFMDKGKICEVSLAKEFFAQPKSQAAQNYLQGKLA